MKNILKIIKWGVILTLGFITLLNLGIFLSTEVFMSCRFQSLTHAGPLPENFKCTNSGIMGSVEKIPAEKVKNEIICPVGMGTIYATGTKMAISCHEFETSKAGKIVSAEVDYSPHKNLINLSVEESEKIVKKLLIKRDSEIKQHNNTGSLLQGDWKAVYNPPKYPDGYDSITATMSGKTYALPGVYGKEERDRYMKNLRAGTGCVSYIQGPYPEQGTPNVLINGIYYYPPNSGDCMSGVRTFGYFDSFSPSGYYIFYAIYGYEFAEIRLVSMVDGKNFLEGKNGALWTHLTWSTDKKQLLYIVEGSMGDGTEPGIYMTKIGSFPDAEKIGNTSNSNYSSLIVDMDNDYIYILEEYVEYYLRVLNREDYQEVYGRVVKK